MKDLIEALTIFSKYTDTRCPTICSHDMLSIAGVDREQVSEEDRKRLEELDFIWDDDDEFYFSYRFGSA